jgi:hypothetical protein
MAGAEGTGAFGKDGEGVAGSKEFVAAVHGIGIAGAVVFGLIFVADDGDAGKEEAGEKIFLELRGDHERGRGEDGFVDPTVDGAVAVKGDDEGGTGEGGACGKDVDAREVDTGAKLREEAVPENWHEVEFTMGGGAALRGSWRRVSEW